MNKIYFLIISLFFTIGYSQNDKKDLEKIESYIASKEFDKSLNLVSDLIKNDSLNSKYFLKKAEILEYLERFQECQNTFQKAVKLSPKSPEVYEKMSFFHLRLNYFDNAIKECNIGLALEQNDREITISLFLVRSQSFYLKDQYDEAIKDFKTILSYNPNESIGSMTYLNLASSLVKIKKNDEAITYLEECLKKYPNFLLGMNNLAYRYSEKGEYLKSLELYERGLKLAQELKSNEDGKVNFSKKLIGEKGSDKISLGLIYNNMGFVKYKLKRYDQALIDINKSIELYPENSYVYRNKALVYIDLKSMDKACIEIEKSIELGFTKQYGNEVFELKNKHCK
jgi:tetratricopeptide (TPR) repeat protein